MTVAETPATALGERLGSYLGDSARRRPPPSLEMGLAGIGEPLFSVAVSALAADRWTKSGSTGLALLMTAGVAGLGLAAMVRGDLAALCLVGSYAGRRATVWAGLAALAFGVSALAGALSGGDESAALFAFFVGAAGAGLVFVAPVVGARMPPPPPSFTL